METAIRDSAFEAECLAKGFDLFSQKPVQIQQLAQTLIMLGFIQSLTF